MISNDYISLHGKESLAIISLLSRNLTIRSEVVFSFRYLFNGLGIGLNRKEAKNNIIKCVNSMFNANYKNDINIDQTLRLPFNTVKSQYLILYDDEVDYLLSCTKKIDKYNLFNTYVAIKRYINHETGTAFPSIESLMNIVNVSSNNSILKYIETLEEMDMIKCYRNYDYVVSSMGIRRPNNTYELVKFNKNIIN